MPRYIALLRAINVGGHVVKMDRLRRLFEALDFSNVEYLASAAATSDGKASMASRQTPGRRNGKATARRRPAYSTWAQPSGMPQQRTPDCLTWR